jgi:hypothetical protein
VKEGKRGRGRQGTKRERKREREMEWDWARVWRGDISWIKHIISWIKLYYLRG